MACTASRATGSELRETSWAFPPAAAAHTSQAGQAHRPGDRLTRATPVKRWEHRHPQSPWGRWHEEGLLLASVQHRWAMFPTPRFGRAGSRLRGRTRELGPGHDPGGFRAAAALKTGGLVGAPQHPGPGRGTVGPEDRQDQGSRAGPGQRGPEFQEQPQEPTPGSTQRGAESCLIGERGQDRGHHGGSRQNGRRQPWAWKDCWVKHLHTAGVVM